jgi:hypothetical protein
MGLRRDAFVSRVGGIFMKLGLPIEVPNAGFTSQAIYLRNFLVPLSLVQLSRHFQCICRYVAGSQHILNLTLAACRLVFLCCVESDNNERLLRVKGVLTF